MKNMIRPAVVASVVVFAAAAFADDWASPRPRVFASPSGEFAFKVIPDERANDGGRTPPTRGVLFTLDPKGNERVVWEKQLVNTPLRAHVADAGGYVVTIDTHYNAGGPHSLLVYGPKGAVVADYGLEDLLTKEEIDKHVSRSTSSRWWASGAEVSIEPEKKLAVVKLKWGKSISVSLETGKLGPRS
jgi:hypothetical protein